jgi:hypothetical protein
VIYCVIPPELEDEMFAKLVAYYDDKPDVTVVVDRRTGRERRSGWTPVEEEHRSPGDRRGRAGRGGFISTDVRDP